MGAPMIVHVTERLKNELAATGRVLAALDKEEAARRHSRNGLNDKDHFVQVVESLEPLVLATLGATTSVPLTAMSVQPGARFDMGAGTQLAHQVTAVVAYLRDTAAELLAVGGFSQYARDNVDVALAYLKKLNGLLLAGIIKQAEADLDTVKGKGASPLIAAAERLARLATAKPVSDTVGGNQDMTATGAKRDVPAAPAQRREDREGTWNPAG